MAAKSPKSPRNQNQRQSAEVQELRLRLEEAEQALEAIRTGQAESLIVEGPSGPRVFSLQGADHSYRVLVEAMNEGAATLGEDGTILYGNARFAKMLDAVKPEAVATFTDTAGHAGVVEACAPRHITVMMDIWGGVDAIKAHAPAIVDTREGDDRLLNGPKLEDDIGHASQDDIDALFD